MCDGHPINRRKVLKLVVAGIGVTTGGILGVPAAITTFSPVVKNERRENWRVLGRLDEFNLGQMQSATVSTRLERDFLDVATKKQIYVWRKTEQEFVVFSRSCTDLGCPVNYDKGSECFFCPCHGGIFSKEGERMAGPPKLPLYRYRTRLTDEFLEIDLSSVPIFV